MLLVKLDPFLLEVMICWSSTVLNKALGSHLNIVSTTVFNDKMLGLTNKVLFVLNKHIVVWCVFTSLKLFNNSRSQVSDNAFLNNT